MSINTLELRYSADEILSDGDTVTIRAIRPDDGEPLAEHFSSLSEDSRYRRFFGLRHGFGPDELERLTAPDYPSHIALVATIENENGDKIIIGDGRGVAVPDQPGVAELALSVSDSYQGRGVGSILLRHLLHCARAAGFNKLASDVLASNTPAMRFLVRHRFRTVERAAGICSFVRLVDDESEGASDAEPATTAIRKRAHELYLERGRGEGRALDDWLAAEREKAS
jgi:GNAT superfamily N-acetyltransferase